MGLFRKKININKDGFSLLEIVIAVGLFSLIMLVVTSLFQLVLSSQRTAITTANIQENMRYAFETMAKEIRMAQKGTDTDLCDLVGAGEVYRVYNVPNNSKLAFINQYGECVSYTWSSKGGENSMILLDRNGAQAFITSEEMKIIGLNFLVDNSAQPRVTIVADIEIPVKGGTSQSMKIQTTISSRQYQ
ncbi:MAG: prepilin-type N-terminal cleavage/methylation domain-containing protein [Patescibacteria group bacterium]|nr:prepilin-type N-terminal cleavage/methylation domain-containing protein [Patescibacteria group bacterium]MDD4611271.1 prepilin-type N-terminal cleavage/methylation domain-containing protein [Patescibacteria group bacterium]